MAKDLNTPQDGLQEVVPIDKGTPPQEKVDGPFDFDELLGGDSGLAGFPDEIVSAEKKEKEVKPGTPSVAPNPNDAVRYEYFQSEAAKNKNELEAMKLQNAQLQAAVQGLQVPVQPPKPVEKSVPQIPESPKQPEKPAYFSREELTDPSSSSAKYMNSMETWRNDMVVHNNKVIQMNAEAQTNQFKKFKEDAVKEANHKEAVVEQQRQLSYLANQLKSKYSATDEQVQSFIQEMSNPDSVSVDNLWQLHQINHGVPVNSVQSKNIPTGQKAVHQPSADFKQTKKAQGIPETMGVMPGQNVQESKKVEDVMIDQMIEMENKENPFT